jgi:hypothetical protein
MKHSEAFSGENASSREAQCRFEWSRICLVPGGRFQFRDNFRVVALSGNIAFVNKLADIHPMLEAALFTRIEGLHDEPDVHRGMSSRSGLDKFRHITPGQ